MTDPPLDRGDSGVLLLPGWSRECLTEWGPYMSLAIPGMLMLCVEWWTYEIGSFLAGTRPRSLEDQRAPLSQRPLGETGTVDSHV